MKSIITFCVTLLALNLLAQKNIVWFDCGLKVQGGASGFYNQAIEKTTGINHEFGLTSGYGIGGKIGINKHYTGLSLEGYYSKGNQNVEVISTSDASYSYDWKSVDIYALLRNAKNLGYFEIGPKMSLLNSMSRTLGTTTSDVTGDFNKMNYAGVLGFGANIMGNDGRFSGILGLRLEYGFTDFVKTGNLSHPLSLVNAADRTTTNPYFAGIVFELNWGIGYFGKAQCGARSKFIMF